MAEPCVREGLTPLNSGELLVDCTVHGMVGRIPAGRREFERAEKLFATHVAANSGPGRWVMHGLYGGRRYDYPQCRYCGRLAERDCPPATCLLCDTTQCHGNGSGNGCCSVCHYGYLPGWSRNADQATCGYAGCDRPAVAVAHRVRRVCLPDAQRATLRSAGQTMTLAEWATERVAERNAGRPDWARWTYLLDAVARR